MRVRVHVRVRVRVHVVNSDCDCLLYFSDGKSDDISIKQYQCISNHIKSSYVANGMY